MAQKKAFLSVRLSKQESQKLDSMCKASGLTASAAVRKLIAGAKIQENKAKDMKPLYQEINRIGNNINQIARNINTGVMEEDTDILNIKLQEILTVLQIIETAVWVLKEHDVYGSVGYDAGVSVKEEA